MAPLRTQSLTLPQLNRRLDLHGPSPVARLRDADNITFPRVLRAFNRLRYNARLTDYSEALKHPDQRVHCAFCPKTDRLQAAIFYTLAGDHVVLHYLDPGDLSAPNKAQSIVAFFGDWVKKVRAIRVPFTDTPTARCITELFPDPSIVVAEPPFMYMERTSMLIPIVPVFEEGKPSEAMARFRALKDRAYPRALISVEDFSYDPLKHIPAPMFAQSLTTW